MRIQVCQIPKPCSHVLSILQEKLPEVSHSYISLESYKAGSGESQGGEVGRVGAGQKEPCPDYRVKRSQMMYLKVQPPMSKEQKRTGVQEA